MSGFRVLRLKNKRPLLILLIIIILTGTVIYQSYKPLPENISYEGDIHKVEDVNFLYDLTYKIEGRVEADQMIFDAVFKAIDEAEEFIVIDLFLFNGYYDRGETYPKLSKELSDRLLKKKKANPEMEIVFITDDINTSYGSHASKELDAFKDAGIDVVISDIMPCVTQIRSIPVFGELFSNGLASLVQAGFQILLAIRHQTSISDLI